MYKPERCDCCCANAWTRIPEEIGGLESERNLRTIVLEEKRARKCSLVLFSVANLLEHPPSFDGEEKAILGDVMTPSQ